MEGRIILDGMMASDLIGAITEIVRAELAAANPEPEQLLTREDTANYLKCGTSTLSKWVQEGRLKCYGIGGRKYFKKTEVDAALELLLII